ncbi:hypothetical protein [Paenibacillus glucanolyticus]|uniref:hypothetical protein n=1 Tax=Paenibacillus glucanolyticus TaxID=59843 RepID=UPI00128DD1F7|nr:hypothetical protein [Paenibacillus glucanolyticus]MCA4755542.1 hypothetical protein [Mycolicibacterium fortuitum]MPY20667.1 hypothetical protein [Paenibacillus glucanolyticus]
MNEENYLRKKMVQALQTERSMLEEGRLLEALDARYEYRRSRQQLLQLWGDRRNEMQTAM